MEEKVSTTLKGLDGELKGTYYPLTGMDKATQQQLIDDHFLFKEGDRFLQAANACRYWPSGRGIYHNDAKTFLVWCNEEDHLRIISMQKGGDLKQVFGRLVTAVKAIEAKLPFSRDDRLGYLTFCPTNLGTTIRASVHIALPKLAADRAKLEDIASKYSLQVRGKFFIIAQYKKNIYKQAQRELIEENQPDRLTVFLFVSSSEVSLEVVKGFYIYSFIHGHVSYTHKSIGLT